MAKYEVEIKEANMFVDMSMMSLLQGHVKVEGEDDDDDEKEEGEGRDKFEENGLGKSGGYSDSDSNGGGGGGSSGGEVEGAESWKLEGGERLSEDLAANMAVKDKSKKARQELRRVRYAEHRHGGDSRDITADVNDTVFM